MLEGRFVAAAAAERKENGYHLFPVLWYIFFSPQMPRESHKNGEQAYFSACVAILLHAVCFILLISLLWF